MTQPAPTSHEIKVRKQNSSARYHFPPDLTASDIFPSRPQAWSQQGWTWNSHLRRKHKADTWRLEGSSQGPDSYSDCGEKCLVPLGGQHRHSYGTQSSKLRVQDIQRYVIIFPLKATYLNYMWDLINFSKIIAQIEIHRCQEDQLHVLDYKYPFGKQIFPVTLKNS